MKQPSFKQKFQYWFDNYMARGTGALIFALFVLSALIIFVIAALVKITGSAPNNESLFELAWMALLRTLNQEGQTLLMVTHEADMAAYTRRVLHFRDGRVERDERRESP